MTDRLLAAPRSTEAAASRLPSHWRRIALLAVAVTALACGLLFAGGAHALIVAAPAALLVGTAAALLALHRFEYFVLALLCLRASTDVAEAGSLVDVNTALSAGLLVCGLVWLAGDLRGGGPRLPTTRPTLAVLVTGLFSTLASADPQVSLVQWLRIASALLMLEILMRLVKSERSQRRLLIAVLLSAIPPIVVGLTQVATTDGGLEIGGFYRVIGTFTHPNPYAIYLVMIMTMGIAMAPTVSRPWQRLFLACATAGAALCLVFTYTRSAWIAAGLAIATVGLVQRRRVLLWILAGSVAVAMMTPAVSARWSDLTESTQRSGDANNSLAWRLYHWGSAFEMAETKPLVGLGLGMLEAESAEQKAAHNDLVRAYVETGVLGLGAYLWWLGTVVMLGIRALRRATTSFARSVAAGYAGIIVALSLLCLVSNLVSQVVLLWYVAAFAAATHASTLVSRGPVQMERVGADADSAGQ